MRRRLRAGGKLTGRRMHLAEGVIMARPPSPPPATRFAPRHQAQPKSAPHPRPSVPPPPTRFAARPLQRAAAPAAAAAGNAVPHPVPAPAAAAVAVAPAARPDVLYHAAPLTAFTLIVEQGIKTMSGGGQYLCMSQDFDGAVTRDRGAQDYVFRVVPDFLPDDLWASFGKAGAGQNEWRATQPIPPEHLTYTKRLAGDRGWKEATNAPAAERAISTRARERTDARAAALAKAKKGTTSAAAAPPAKAASKK